MLSARTVHAPPRMVIPAPSPEFAELLRPERLPEVWFWRRDGLELHALDSQGAAYVRVPRRRLLPQLDVALLERCVRIVSWREARQTFRSGLAAEPEPCR